MKLLIKRHTKPLLFLLIFSSILLRLFLAFSFEGTGDSGGWRLAGKTGLHNKQYGMGNGTVYDGDCPLLCSNWPPLVYHYYVAMRWIYENVNPFSLPQWGFYKLIPVLSSLGIIFALYKFFRLYKMKKWLFLILLMAFHPLSLYISAYHGQRESSWLMFLLLAILAYKNKRYILFSMLFGIAVSIKLPPLLFAPFLLLKLPTKKDKLLFVLTILLIFYILSLPEIALYTENVIRQVFFYPGWKGWWGLSGIITKVSAYLNVAEFSELFYLLNKMLLYSGIIIATLFFVKRKVDIRESLLGITMVVFVFSPVYASQYMLWPLPFMLLLYNKYKSYFWLYSVFSLYAAVNTYGLFGIRPLEFLFLEIPQKYIYYKLFLSYPMDLYFPVWIISIMLMLHIIGGSKFKVRIKYLHKVAWKYKETIFSYRRINFSLLQYKNKIR